MYDIDRLLKALTLSVVVLGSVRPSSAFFLPPSGGDLRRSPPAAVARRQHDQQQCVLRRHRRQRSSQQGLQQSRSVRSRPHFSSSAAPADAARDEEPWKDDLEAAAEAPFFPPPYYGSQQQQQQYPTSSAAGRVVGQSRDAFTFAPKPLREGRVLRAMKRADVDGVVNLAFEEYYNGPMDFSAGLRGGFAVLESAWRSALRNGKFQEADKERLTDWLEMIWLRIMIQWGFSMREQFGKGGRDHRVFCISDEKAGHLGGDGDGGSKPPLAALAEISLQVPNGKTSPPFPVPLWYKRIVGWPGPVLPYISNVLVHRNARRQGLANRLMLRCEKQARDWGFTQARLHKVVYLHVDLTYYPAVRMYETMGYEVVSDLEVSFENPRLRYMKKIL
ncbi:unnamed protein product [Ectocarpus sp. CCAP 1310/34]|nr:unnamed protein product [Ectocarpus sp. CCAP 1310/34]